MRRRSLKRELIYSGRFFWTAVRKYAPHAKTAEIKKLNNLPREFLQQACSDVTENKVASPDADRYFDYGAAVALRNIAARFGTES